MIFSIIVATCAAVVSWLVVVSRYREVRHLRDEIVSLASQLDHLAQDNYELIRENKKLYSTLENYREALNEAMNEESLEDGERYVRQSLGLKEDQ